MGLDEDPAAALHLYRQAAEQGHSEALHGLAVLYHEGRGVERNGVEALKYLYIAIHEECEEARARLEEIESALSREEIAEARELARAYIDSVDGDTAHMGSGPVSFSE